MKTEKMVIALVGGSQETQKKTEGDECQEALLIDVMYEMINYKGCLS